MRTLAVLSLIALTTTSISARADTEEPPERNDPYARMSTEELQQILSQSQNLAVVGLKPPGERRGIWKNRLLTSPSIAQGAITSIVNTPGVKLIDRSPNILPYIVVELTGGAALRRLRNLPHIDYIEPLYAGASIQSGSGCSSNNTWTGSTETMPGEHDVVPWTFFEHNIPDAWERTGGGRGITVGAVDTGVYQDQPQLRSHFATGKSTARSFIHDYTEPSDGGYDSCGHGTRIAGILAAPRDNRNIVGVAWEADLATVKVLDGVWIGGQSTKVADGIIKAAVNGARIFTLAIGLTDSTSQVIEDAIYTTRSTHDVIMIAAAGTAFCSGFFSHDDGVIFPANLSDSDGEPLLAVTGADANGNRVSGVCGGPEVDLTARIESPTTGETETDIVSLGGSSQATALIAGVAALVWSQNPTMSASDIKKILLSSGERSTRDSITGFGRIDAELAASKVFPVAAFPALF